MATKKAASTKKKTTAKKTAASKTTVRIDAGCFDYIQRRRRWRVSYRLHASNASDEHRRCLGLARQPSRNIWFVDYAQAQDNPAAILLGRPVHRRYAGCNHHQLGYWRFNQLRL